VFPYQARNKTFGFNAEFQLPVRNSTCIVGPHNNATVQVASSGVREVPSSNLGQKTDYSDRSFVRLSLVCSGKCQDIAWNWAITASFHISSNILFTLHPDMPWQRTNQVSALPTKFVKENFKLIMRTLKTLHDNIKISLPEGVDVT
jgi:hypothetical protein